MKVMNSYIAGVKIIDIQQVHEARGWARNIFNINRLRSNGEYPNFRYSYDMWFDKANTYRGCYFQREPMDYEMLVYCPKGKMLIVSVDIRPLSKTYKKYSVIEVSADNMRQVYTKRGFAHSFISLEDDTYVIMKSDIHITDLKYHTVFNFWQTCEIKNSFDQFGIAADELIISAEDLMAPPLYKIEGFLEADEEDDEDTVDGSLIDENYTV